MLQDKDRIFTNIYGLDDPFLARAKKRGHRHIHGKRTKHQMRKEHRPFEREIHKSVEKSGWIGEQRDPLPFKRGENQQTIYVAVENLLRLYKHGQRKHRQGSYRIYGESEQDR